MNVVGEASGESEFKFADDFFGDTVSDGVPYQPEFSDICNEDFEEKKMELWLPSG